MDAQGRGHAGEVDPADQWVFNPQTGSYELRLDPVTPGPAAPTASPSGAPRTHSGGSARPDGPPSGRRPADPAVPGRRTADGATAGRRGAEAPGSGRRAARAATRQPTEAPGRVPGQRSRPRRGEPEPPTRGRRKRKPKLTGRQKALRWGGGTMAVVLVALCTTGYLVYKHFNDNIDKVDVGISNNATSNGPVNILLLGTDARTGAGNQGYGDAESAGHADTTVLLHVSKDRSHATALSIPRDMVVDIPDCPTKQGGDERVIPGSPNTRFNESLGQNGRDPGCTWRTVQEITGLEINHFMMADFNAVKTLSTAVGGVEVCVAKDIDDKKSKLKLTKGVHRIQGEDALAFVRTRDSVGLRSDLSRIELQQQFLSSMFREVRASGSLANPTKAWKLADAATKALTVDTGIGQVTKLAELASDLQRVNPKNITFATLPVIDNPNDPKKATVVLDEPKARTIFQMIKADKSLAGTGKDGKGSKEKEDVPRVPAAEVRVNVYNGGGPIGSAQQTVSWLQNSHSARLATNSGNADTTQRTTTLEYGPDQAGQAATLAKLMGLPKKALRKQAEDAGEGVPMTLTLGADFVAAGTPIEAPDEAPEGVQKINGGDKNVCAK
ncbi:LCP family protein [Streptomyces sp. OF3]|uniref:LCP family protein n=1 Tax=Streptomyces alkaliterrae TaxID=2213162 RepID=A0A7W3WPH7_9ACTN|nr:LCP family protein [Streptomyces alkaliterrae]